MADPRLAIEAALQLGPDVAFLDIGMPHINGYELAAMLRERFGSKLCLVAACASDRRLKRSAGNPEGREKL